MPAQADDLLILERGGTLYKEAHRDVAPILFHLGGQLLLDPNEFNGWGVLGPFDNTNSQDLGNVGAGVSRVAGGVVYPFDVRLTRFYAWHYNSNGSAQAWGWRIARQVKNAGSNTVSSLNMLNEVGDNGGVGPRDYGNNQNQLTDIASFTNDVVPAGETVVLGVEAPTAVTTNYYSRVLSGYLQFERV